MAPGVPAVMWKSTSRWPGPFCHRSTACAVSTLRGNRLRGLRDQWRAGTIDGSDAAARIEAWIAHTSHADTWRLRHAIFRDGWFDPSRGAWPPPSRRVLRGGSWNNNPTNICPGVRNRNDTDNRNNNVGFRLASTPPCQNRTDQGPAGRAEGEFRDGHDGWVAIVPSSAARVLAFGRPAPLPIS